MATPRADALDRLIGGRIRERRIELGLTQQQMSELVGVTYQQIHKYEKGINRTPSTGLHRIAQVLNVEIGYFFETLGSTKPLPDPEKRILRLVRGFKELSNHEQLAVLALVNSLGSATLPNGRLNLAGLKVVE